HPLNNGIAVSIKNGRGLKLAAQRPQFEFYLKYRCSSIVIYERLSPFPLTAIFW
ncbi:21130_t:CDS:2, partial [Gigaspora rosea]